MHSNERKTKEKENQTKDVQGQVCLFASLMFAGPPNYVPLF